MDILRMLS